MKNLHSAFHLLEIISHLVKSYTHTNILKHFVGSFSLYCKHCTAEATESNLRTNLYCPMGKHGDV
jgi:uncharacterized protein YbgA (DUF1722 family)